jgi:uncharacterized membrane protein HdeD (DUF308 family)
MTAIVAEHRGWFTFLGIVLIVIGVVAIAFPLMTTIAAKIFLGWLFIIGGGVQVVHAFSTKTWSEFLFNLIIGALYIVIGAWLAFLPFSGIITLTVLLAVLFIIEGVMEIGMGYRLRPKGGWAWLAISGIIAIAAGVLVLAGLPSTAAWAIGLLVGINLIFAGIALTMTAMAADKLPE